MDNTGADTVRDFAALTASALKSFDLETFCEEDSLGSSLETTGRRSGWLRSPLAAIAAYLIEVREEITN